MKTRILIVVIVLLSIIPVGAHAVENGEDATGSAFVVPISIDKGNGKWGGCSGTLIAPSIVVTAGHCVLDANGLLTKNIYVGVAGSSIGTVTLDDKIFSIQITSSFQNASGGKVGDDDLAFLTLGKSQTLRIPIILASEKEVTDLKSRKVALKSIGYGNYTNSATEPVTFPKSFDGTYSLVNTIYSNSAYMSSTNGRSCTGDSGAPILSISATQVTLVGILTGTIRGVDNQCAQKQSDGNYYTLFTLVGRYANLAFSAATEVINLQLQATEADKVQIADLVNKLDEATNANSEVQSQLDEANTTIVELKAKLPQVITCIKGKLTKKVTAVKPKCPAGYKVKT
jgi:V8-like Glu-specific endopeptidase